MICKLVLTIFFPTGTLIIAGNTAWLGQTTGRLLFEREKEAQQRQAKCHHKGSHPEPLSWPHYGKLPQGIFEAFPCSSPLGYYELLPLWVGQTRPIARSPAQTVALEACGAHHHGLHAKSPARQQRQLIGLEGLVRRRVHGGLEVSLGALSVCLGSSGLLADVFCPLRNPNETNRWGFPLTIGVWRCSGVVSNKNQGFKSPSQHSLENS